MLNGSNVRCVMYEHIQARFGRLNDPLLHCERTRLEEERIALECVTSERLSSLASVERLVNTPAMPLVPRGRENISWKQWVSMNVSDIESEQHQKSRSACITLSNGLVCVSVDAGR